MKSYTVAAIFQIGMTTFDNTFIFMPLTEAQTFFNQDGQASVIEVYVADPDDMDAMRRKIEPAQGRPMIDTDWRQLNRSFFDVLAVESNVMFAILTLIMLVAALNIISGLIMLVQDKARRHRRPAHDGRDARRDHAHLSASPARPSDSSARAVGLALGLLVAYNVEPIRKGLSWITGANLFPSDFYFLSQLPSRVEMTDVLSVVALALILSLAATIYPSWRAAQARSGRGASL